MVVLAGKMETGKAHAGVRSWDRMLLCQGIVEPLTNYSIPSTTTQSAVDTVSYQMET